jgi:hypothetical protein
MHTHTHTHTHKARAEPIRLAFAIGGVDFDDVRISREEFHAQKAQGAYPFGQLPVMEVDGKLVSQSQALLRYAGKLAGLYPSDPVQALLVDEMIGAVEDVIQATVPNFREQDEEKRVSERERGCLCVWLVLRVWVNERGAVCGDGCGRRGDFSLLALCLCYHLTPTTPNNTHDLSHPEIPPPTPEGPAGGAGGVDVPQVVRDDLEEARGERPGGHGILRGGAALHRRPHCMLLLV